MKKILLILCLISISVSAQHADSLFIRANKLYQNENYLEALKLYQEIENNNIQSADLYYNIANANYKLNKVAPSIYYYEKALLLNPNHEDAKFNLEFAKQMIIDNIEPLPKTVSQKFNEALILKLTYNNWAWIAVSLSILFAVLFLLYHFSFRSAKKRFYFISSITIGIISIVCIIFAYQNFNYNKKNRPAIIFAQQTDVKNAPTMSSEMSFELHEGTKVQILESLDNWEKIKIADGKIGWMLTDDLKELK